jgi:hypothetical protein
MEEQRPVTMHVCSTACAEGEHDWNGPEYRRETAGGGEECGATCAKCGMEFGHWALFNLD